MKTSKTMPTLSTVVITYNQEQYIRQALESIVSQVVDFPIEVIVADDGSTDQTQKIIREFSEKYGYIKPIFRKKNIGAWQNFVDALQHTRGEFIALCEGDDYWTDRKKLQRQVTLLRQHPSYTLCFHPVRVVYEGREDGSYIFPEPQKPSKYTLEELLKENFVQTNSVVYRRQDYSRMPDDILPGDWYTHLFHARYGKIGFINEVMSVYRKHEQGLWWKISWEKYGVRYLGMFTAVMELFGAQAKYRNILEPSIISMFHRLITVDKEKGTHLIGEASAKYPASTELFVKEQNNSIQQSERELELRNWVIGRLITDVSRTMEHSNHILSSVSFQSGYYVLHPWKAPRKLVTMGKHRVVRARHKMQSGGGLQRITRQYEQFDHVLSQFDNSSSKKSAVILHLYYPDLWDYFCDHLSVLDPANFDLFITLPREDELVNSKIREVYPNACLLVAPNRGRDVLPFLKTLAGIRSKGYEYVLKLHSKKSKHWDGGNVWLKNLTENLLPNNPTVLGEILSALEKKNTAIVGPSGEYVSLLVNYEPNKSIFRNTLTESVSAKAARYIDGYRHEYGFFAGTMFWARLDALDTILNRSFGPEKFEPEKGQIDATFAHTIERLLTVIPELEEKKIYEVGQDGVRHLPYRTYNIPEWADVYIGKIKRDRPKLEEFEKPTAIQE